MTTVFAMYIACVSLLAIGMVLYDKRAAIKRWRRIRERTLMLVSALGGSAAMLAAMRIARHKTRHAFFMIGIPIIIVLQTALIGLILWWRMKTGAP